MRLAIVSCASVVWNIAFTDPVMGWAGAASEVGSRGSSVQRPFVALDLVPVSITRSSRVMVTLEWVKTALQPWSHSWPIDKREWESKDGKTWARQADNGRPGTGRVPVCELRMRAPSGKLTAMPFVVGLSPRRMLEILKKCPVAPESIIIGGEGEDILEELSRLVIFTLFA
jgi:hypothetical protein